MIQGTPKPYRVKGGSYEKYQPKGKLIMALETIHECDSMPFRFALHYVGVDKRIGIGIELLLDYVFELSEKGDSDADCLLEQLGYTINDIKKHKE